MTSRCVHEKVSIDEAAVIIHESFQRELLTNANTWQLMITRFILAANLSKSWAINHLNTLKKAIGTVETEYCSFCDDIKARKEGKEYRRTIRCFNKVSLDPEYSIVFTLSVKPINTKNILLDYLQELDVKDVIDPEGNWSIE